VAVAVSSALVRRERPRIRPAGRPRKMVKPAMAPSVRICAWDTCGSLDQKCKAGLTRLREYSDHDRAKSNGRRCMPHAQGHSVDEYLETIYCLAFPIGEYRPATGTNAIAARVAEMLGVSRASAGEMLKRMEADGLVERGEHKEAILTPAGIERAERVVRKHRLIERFLTDFMGYTAAESHVQADE